MDGAICQVDGCGERPSIRLIAIVIPVPAAIAKIFKQSVHGHLARHLARSLAAHAVTHDKNPVARVITEVVFVILAYASNVRFAGNIHRKRHCNSYSACPIQQTPKGPEMLLENGLCREEDGADCTRIVNYLAIRDLPPYMDHASRRFDKPLLPNMMARFFLVDH